MEARWLIALIVLTGCTQLLGFEDVTPAPGDGSIDVSPTDGSSDASFCYGQVGGLARVCIAGPATRSLQVTDSEPIDTDSAQSCTTFSQGSTTLGGACLLVVQDLVIATGATMSTSGTRPLILLATDTITIAGNLVAYGGPAISACSTGPATGTGGGAGGSFIGRGGSGGGGAMPGAALTIAGVHGGCPGSSGGGVMPAMGGAGGGAVYLIAGARITVSGTIAAFGRGGGGGGGGGGGLGLGQGGGGGGGAGGLIGLDAPAIGVVGARLDANGGGGGCGSAGPSVNGGDGDTSSAPHIRARGCLSPGTVGGAGSVDAMADGITGAFSSGVNGGGGGGGAGLVLFAPPAQVPTSDEAISPPPSHL